MSGSLGLVKANSRQADNPCFCLARVATVILGFLMLAVAANAQVIADTRSILNGVLEKISDINTINYSLSYQERVYESGKMRTGSSNIKFQRYPKRLYIKTKNGMELLWGPDMNNGNVLVHPPSFPFFTLSLDPDGYWMRKDQHHGVEDVGFDYVSTLLKTEIKRAGDRFNSYFIHKGDSLFGGSDCYVIYITAPDFKYETYTVQKDESIITIARSRALNEYLVLKHNPQVGSYTDVKAGNTIFLPSDYAPNITLYIDKQMMLPVLLRVQDEKGTFEEYAYRNLQINPDYNTDEFSKNCTSYHF